LKSQQNLAVAARVASTIKDEIVKEIILDGRKIDTEEELHQFFKKEFDFPDYYGMNLNAFWDCLSEGFEEPTKVIWTNVGDSKKKFGINFVNDIINLFKKGKEFMKDDPIKFDYEIKD
jgi:ribonuclease inhibitor